MMLGHSIQCWISTIILALSIQVSIVAQNSGDEVFDNTYLHEVRISFVEDDYYQILRDNYETNEIGQVPYLMADIAIDGVPVDSVGIRFKGFTSYPFDSAKKPIKVDFNEFVKDKRFDGLRKLNLNNGLADPGMHRDALCYRLMRRMGVDAPRTAYTRLYLNDEYWGAYLLVEQVDKEFVQNNFSNDQGNLFKNLGWSSLEWEGDDVQVYKEDFDLKTNEEADDWSGFIHFLDVLNNTSDAEFESQIESVFNVDLFLRVLAVDVFTGNWDSYLEHGRNWYKYEDVETGIFHWIPWDYNLALGGTFFGDNPATDIAPISIAQQNSDKVLIRRLLSVEAYEEAYLDLFCDLLHIAYDEDDINTFIDHNRDLIQDAYYEDPNKLYSEMVFDEDLGDATAQNSLRMRLFNQHIVKRDELASLTTCLFAANIDYQDVVINEFVASNDSTSGITDPDGEYEDWIELYNNTGAAIDLSDAYLSDKGDDLKKWQFPAGTTIGPDEYLIVWADDDEGQDGLHSNFKLSKGGEAVYLSNADESAIDSIVFDEQMTNVAFARVPNGTGEFMFQEATFSANNDEPSSVEFVSLGEDIEVYPNPARQKVYIDWSDRAPNHLVTIYSSLGREVVQHQPVRQQQTGIDVSDLSAGIYLMTITDLDDGSQASTKFIKQ